MSEELPDRELVERAQAELPRRTGAYNEIVRLYTGFVFARAYRILRSTADAEEASQDVFLAVFRSIHSYKPERPFAAWLSTVTLNECRMILRRRAQEQRRREAVAKETPIPVAPTMGDPALRSVLEELLDELDPGTRIPLLMRMVEGYSYGEIASELDVGESAVKMRVSRGSKRLRELYKERSAVPKEERSDD